LLLLLARTAAAADAAQIVVVACPVHARADIRNVDASFRQFFTSLVERRVPVHGFLQHRASDGHRVRDRGPRAERTVGGEPLRDLNQRVVDDRRSHDVLKRSHGFRIA
jgi:hypothetical protein